MNLSGLPETAAKVVSVGIVVSATDDEGLLAVAVVAEVAVDGGVGNGDGAEVVVEVVTGGVAGVVVVVMVVTGVVVVTVVAAGTVAAVDAAGCVYCGLR